MCPVIYRPWLQSEHDNLVFSILLCVIWALSVRGRDVVTTPRLDAACLQIIHVLGYCHMIPTGKTTPSITATCCRKKLYRTMSNHSPTSARNLGQTLRRWFRDETIRWTSPANTSHSPKVGSMLVQRRRRWTNIEPTLGGPTLDRN